MKFFKIIVCLFLMMFLFSGEIKAEEYYWEEVIGTPTISINANVNTKTNTKTVYYKNSSGEKMWSIKVTGTFKYNGNTSTCTNASVSSTVYNSQWKVSNKSASKSGNTATAKATGKMYGKTGDLLKTVNKTVSLTCDKNGKWS